jgi:heptosyltransferase II
LLHSSEKSNSTWASPWIPGKRVTLIKWLAGIPRRISAERALGWELKWERLFYTDDLRLDGWNYQEHRMAESFYEIFRRFFHDTDGTYLPPVLKPSAETDLQAVENMLQQAFHDQAIAPAKRIAFCVQTTNERKDWRPERFAALADRLVEHYQAAIVLTGISAHAARARQVLDHMKHPEYAVDLIGKTTFPQIVALCRKVDLYVTLDTGNTHIAAAAGCPVVTIFSYNSPTIYGGSSEKLPDRQCRSSLFRQAHLQPSPGMSQNRLLRLRDRRPGVGCHPESGLLARAAPLKTSNSAKTGTVKK